MTKEFVIVLEGSEEALAEAVKQFTEQFQELVGFTAPDAKFKCTGITTRDIV